MKNTIITLASVAALAGSVNAQTFSGPLANVTAVSGSTDTWDFGNGLTSTSTRTSEVSVPTVGHTFHNYNTGGFDGTTSNPRAGVVHTFSENIGSMDVSFTDFDYSAQSPATYRWLFDFSEAPVVTNTSVASGYNLVASVAGNRLTVELDHPSGPLFAANARVDVNFSGMNRSTFGISEGFSNVPGNDTVTVKYYAAEVVPEPSSTALLGLGGLALILRRRK